jgi:hypothetical protein
MNIDDSELLILLGNTRWYEPLQHVMYRATDNELIAVATVPGSTAHYTFSISPDKTTITGSGINRAGIKVELFTKTELLGSRRIAPDLLLGLSALYSFDFRFSATIVASEAHVRVKRARVASEAHNRPSEARPVPQTTSSSSDAVSQSLNYSQRPTRSRLTNLALRLFFGQGHNF